MDMSIRTRADGGKICLEGDLWPGEAEEGDRFCIEVDDLTIYADGGTKPLVKFSPSTLGNNVLCTRYVGTKAIPREFPIVWLQDGEIEEEQRAEDDVSAEASAPKEPLSVGPTPEQGAGVEQPVAADPTTGAPTVAEPEPQATTLETVQEPQVIKPAAIEAPAVDPGGDTGGSG